MGMFDNLRDGSMLCLARRYDSISATVLKKVRGTSDAGAICRNLVTIGHSIPIDQASSAERSATLRRLGGDGGLHEQQVDEVGDSRFSVALYSRSGSRRICDSAR